MLFTPQAGASLQIFKTEMGGDGQSTEATEPSHMHTKDDENYQRGYEWWLMKEAKARNPAIKLYTLAWTAPAWIGQADNATAAANKAKGLPGGYYSQNNIDYHLKWIRGAKREHNLTLDYIGIWNEHTYDTNWILALRRAMDADPVAKGVQIVAADKDFAPICADMMNNSTLRDAVAVIGAHYPLKGARSGGVPSDCQTLSTQYGKPLWTSEGWSLAEVNDWHGAANLALTINQNYVVQRQTAMIVWNLIYSWYSIFPFSHPDGTTVGGMGHGLMSATEPWSGHYRIEAPLYMVAHTAQFTTPGKCKYLANAGVGHAPGGWVDAPNVSSIVVFLCDHDWTAVIETMSAPHGSFPGPTTFTLANQPAQEEPATDAVGGGGRTLHVWQTCENVSQWFQKMPDVSVGADGTFQVQLQPQCTTTITTMAGGGAAPSNQIPPSRHMSVDYADNFSTYKDQAPVRYFTDEGGSFNAAPDLANRANTVLEQAVTAKPIHGNWWDDGEPWTVMGDSQTWADYTVSVKARMDGHSPSPPPPPPGPPAPPVTQISQASAKSPNAGQCLNVMGASSSPGASVFAYPCNQARALHFTTAHGQSPGRSGYEPDSGGVASGSGNPDSDWAIVDGKLRSMGNCATAMPDGSVKMQVCQSNGVGQQWESHWPTIKQIGTGTGTGTGTGCLALGAASKNWPKNLMAVVKPCAPSDPTQAWKNSSSQPSPINKVPAPTFVRVCGQ